MMNLNFEMNRRHATISMISIIQLYSFLKTQRIIQNEHDNYKTIKNATVVTAACINSSTSSFIRPHYIFKRGDSSVRFLHQKNC